MTDLSFEEAVQGLVDLFNSLPWRPNRCHRKYVLRSENGNLVFRFAHERNKPLPPRDEIELAVDQAIDDLFREENEIVPRKLAKSFPGSIAYRDGETY